MTRSPLDSAHTRIARLLGQRAAIREAADRFIRAVHLNAPLGLPDDTPARLCLPDWVTLGDLRRLKHATEMEFGE